MSFDGSKTYFDQVHLPNGDRWFVLDQTQWIGVEWIHEQLVLNWWFLDTISSAPLIGFFSEHFENG